MQTQSQFSIGFPIAGGQWICRQANDIASLEIEMQQALAVYTAAHPAAWLFDIDLSGGGAGQVWICQALMLPDFGEGTPTNIQFVNMAVKWFFASDAHTLQTQENAWLLTLSVDFSLWAWSAAAAGDGAHWGKVMVTFNGSQV